MNRIKLIRSIFRKKGFNTYLEIGTEGRGSFFPIWARNKIAVDPCLNIRKAKKFRWLFKNPHNFFNHYFEETSDTFFKDHKDILLSKGGVDVALVDGLHTFEGALKDVLNTLQFLNEHGVIIMHDCLPPSRSAAMPTALFPTVEQQNSIEGWNGTWCGDVWKSIIYLRNNLGTDLDVCVIDTDLGLGIVRKKSSSIISPDIDRNEFEKIDALTFEDLQKDTENMLNLKPIEYTKELLASISQLKR